MLRIQGLGGDPAEEKKKVREGVISNFVSFGILIALIRLVPHAINALSTSGAAPPRLTP